MSPRAEHGPDHTAQGNQAITLTGLAGRARTWWAEDPSLLRRERDAMSVIAPDLNWTADGAGWWAGLAPTWPFGRPAPPGLDALLAEHRLRVLVTYGHAFPMTAPAVWAVDPEPAIEQRTQHAWHVNGDGSLCLLEAAAAWTGREAAAELVVKASGWFIEYLLMRRGVVTSMTSDGLAADLSVDAVITRAGNSKPDPSGTARGTDDQPVPASPAGTAGHGPGVADSAGTTV